MVSEAMNKEFTGMEESDNQQAILMFIQRWRRVPLQSLIGHFVYSDGKGRMALSTMKDNLKKLVKRGEIAKYREGKAAIYCMPTEPILRKGCASGLDTFLLEEMEKLVSDYLSSGLRCMRGGVDDAEESELEYRACGDERTGRREQLAERAYSLWWELRVLEGLRSYQFPIPGGYSKEEWRSNGYDIIYDFTNSAHISERAWIDSGQKGMKDTESVIFWTGYYILAIDYLSRELSKTYEENRNHVRKKIASRS